MKPPAVAETGRIGHVWKMILARMSPLILIPLASLGLFASAAFALEELPATMKAPEPKPETAGTEETASTTMPRTETQCRERLKTLGVAFEEHEALHDALGCSAPHPVVVSRLSKDVELRPSAVLTCAMAEASANFVRDHAAPLARGEFGSDLATIEQVSAYVCRSRNGTKKLSEHAFANALDWGSLVLEDGTRIEVRTHGSSAPRRARLVKAIQKAACGPFTTVLGPGSDADHTDHFHFDLARRRGGRAWCQ